jgi:membrane protein
MSGPDEEIGVDRMRAVASRVVERIGGLPAVATLRTTLSVYDQAGGGLVAGGLAYSSLLALLPGMLLVVSVVGLLIDDPAVRAEIVAAIGSAVPPLAGVAEAALNGVAAGAVPSGILAILGLLWGSSRFYSAIDRAFARIYRNAPRRNEVQRTVRGLIVTLLFIALPFATLVISSFAAWFADISPASGEVGNLARVLWAIATPIGSFVLFIGGTLLVYRFVPARQVPARAYRLPALLVGIALTLFTQVFTFIAPRLVGTAAIYGTFVAVFALLAWLSIGFNLLLLGGAWTRVRAFGGIEVPGPAGVDAEAGADADAGTAVEAGTDSEGATDEETHRERVTG